MAPGREMPGVQPVIVVTGGTTEYRQIVDAQARKCAQFGYKHLIFDLGGLGIGEPYEVEREDLEPTVNGDSLPPATFKAHLVQRGLGVAKPNESVCWLDADCIPLRGFEPSGSWDAAVTLRPAPEIGLSNNPALDYLNSGVVWFRDNCKGRSLCVTWGILSGQMGTDQGALNQMAGSALDKAGWLRYLGKTIPQNCGGNVLILDCAEWNNWSPPFTGARIAHFKRGLRGQAVNYL